MSNLRSLRVCQWYTHTTHDRKTARRQTGNNTPNEVLEKLAEAIGDLTSKFVGGVDQLESIPFETSLVLERLCVNLASGVEFSKSSGAQIDVVLFWVIEDFFRA